MPVSNPNNFNMIIIDIMLHDINGLNLAKYISKNKSFSNTFLTIISSSDSPDDIAFAKKYGVNIYITKPINGVNENFDILKDIVRKVKKGKLKNRGFQLYDL